MKLSSYFIVPKTKRPLDDENERSTGRMVGNKQEKCSGNSVTCTDHVKRVDDRCLNYYIIIFYFILSASFFFLLLFLLLLCTRRASGQPFFGAQPNATHHYYHYAERSLHFVFLCAACLLYAFVPIITMPLVYHRYK